MCRCAVLALLLAWQIVGGLCVLRFASYYGSHMVLQRGPQSAVVWGHASKIGDTVTASVADSMGKTVVTVTATVMKDSLSTDGIWKLKFPPVTGTGLHTVAISSSEGKANLTDVLFGDVWVCSGQSNMEMSLGSIMNGSAEVTKADTYAYIRIFKTNHVESTKPLEDLQSIATQWTKPTTGTVSSFSAVCFLFGEYLYNHLQVPIGLVESNWGGTPIEAWSSPDALKKCSGNQEDDNHSSLQNPGDKSVLWNAMMNPFLPLTIYGAIWYQGEANAGRPALYACQFPAMIQDWRQKFHDASMGSTPLDLPFGFVQLAPNAKGDNIGGFPPLRWAQSANVGYVPNSKMLKTFMSVAIDLPDFTSPSGSIHPRYKQDVAARLVLGARVVAYKEMNVEFHGPFPNKITANHAMNTVTITYSPAPITVRNNAGFEVCCVDGTAQCGNTWVATPVKGNMANSVTLDTSGCKGKNAASVRYEWRESPCALHMCAVYGQSTGLPAPPFMLPVSSS